MAAGCLEGASDRARITPTGPDGSGLRLLVNDVTLLITQSYPAQVVARVAGTLSDSCSVVDAIEQARDGQTVRVTITVRRTGEVCAQVTRPVDLDVRLEGAFTSGQYVVLVNGVERRFSI